jgi:ABC-type nickel/cobalt efflux system permease component RcnA
METPNPYQAPESPVELPIDDPSALPTSTYLSATLSAVLVCIGATIALGLLFGAIVKAPGLGGLMILTSAPLIGIGLGAISFWEVLQLERRKRQKRYQAMQAPSNDDVPA